MTVLAHSSYFVHVRSGAKQVLGNGSTAWRENVRLCPGSVRKRPRLNPLFAIVIIAISILVGSGNLKDIPYGGFEFLN